MDVDVPAYGSSRNVGGTFRGRAAGNSINLADMSDQEDLHTLRTASVYFYISDVNPAALADISELHPSGSFKHPQVPTVGPVLRQLLRRFPRLSDIPGIFEQYIIFVSCLTFVYVI